MKIREKDCGYDLIGNVLEVIEEEYDECVFRVKSNEYAVVTDKAYMELTKSEAEDIWRDTHSKNFDSITKDDEIEILQKLNNGDTYFGEFFSDKDVKMMCSNIRNDYPLLHNVEFLQDLHKSHEDKVQVLKTNLGQSQKTQKIILRAILKCKTYGELTNFIYGWFSILDIVEIKLEENIQLVNKDKEFCLQVMKEHKNQ